MPAGTMPVDAGTLAAGPKHQAAHPPPPLPPPQQPHHGALWLLLWLFVAAAVPVMVAVLGVLARYLQVTIDPPFPPLRFTSVLSLLSLPTLLLFHTLPSFLLRWRCRRRLKLQAITNSSSNSSTGGSSSQPQGKEADAESSSHSDSESLDGDSNKESLIPEQSEAPAAAHGQQPAVRSSTDRPLPGLGWLQCRHAAAHRIAVALAAAGCCDAAILGQNVAPALVDPAVVMLLSMFAVVIVALLARLWLKTPLRWAVLVPAAAVMIGGAAMVLVPDILAGAGQPGSLTTGRAWLGFGASVGAVLGNAFFIVLAQAYQGTLSAVGTQYTIIGINLLIVLPASLGVDGTDWAAQFSSMGVKEWAALIYCACIAHAWIAVLIAESTMRLGGTTVSMFFGLRLIGSVAGSKVVLGVTIVQTWVQVVGVVLVILAITGYTAVQWHVSTGACRQPPPWQHSSGMKRADSDSCLC